MITYVVGVLMDLVAVLARRRKGKSTGVPVTLELASEQLKLAGVSDGLLSHTVVHDCKTGHAFEVWEVGRWGHDDSRMEVLATGATLGEAMHRWQRKLKPAVPVKRRFASGIGR